MLMQKVFRGRAVFINKKKLFPVKLIFTTFFLFNGFGCEKKENFDIHIKCIGPEKKLTFSESDEDVSRMIYSKTDVSGKVQRIIKLNGFTCKGDGDVIFCLQTLQDRNVANKAIRTVAYTKSTKYVRETLEQTISVNGKQKILKTFFSGYCTSLSAKNS